jgi:hypothetical protein
MNSRVCVCHETGLLASDYRVYVNKRALLGSTFSKPSAVLCVPWLLAVSGWIRHVPQWCEVAEGTALVVCQDSPDLSRFIVSTSASSLWRIYSLLLYWKLEDVECPLTVLKNEPESRVTLRPAVYSSSWH